MSDLQFLNDVSDIPDWENHGKKQCHYKKFAENDIVLGTNMVTTFVVYVHIRICHCHYDREKVPDRSREIHHGHPERPVTEGRTKSEKSVCG